VTGETAKSSSVSVKPHVKRALEEHHVTATQALDQWYDWVIERESLWYERELTKKREECDVLETKLKTAKNRERKLKESDYRVR
jgi:hypothetical protein